MQAIMNFALPTKAKFAFFIGFRYANWIAISAIKLRKTFKKIKYRILDFHTNSNILIITRIGSARNILT